MSGSAPDGGVGIPRETKVRRFAGVTCTDCGRPVGLAWFGGGVELVEPAVEGLPDGGRALRIHQCRAGGKSEPARSRRWGR